MSARHCAKDRGLLEVVPSDSTTGNDTYRCPECGSRYMLMYLPESAANGAILYQVWDESWSGVKGGTE